MAVTRLAAMPGTNRLAPLLALLAVLATLSGCGSDEISGEIPAANAQELNDALDAVSFAVESSQDCEAAQDAADQFVEEVNALPADAGTELKTELRKAGDNLRTLVSDRVPLDRDDRRDRATTTEPTSSTTDTTTSSTTATTTTTTTTSTTRAAKPPGGGNGGGPPGDGTGDGTGGTGGGTGDETGD